jgi:hypothetical protein
MSHVSPPSVTPNVRIENPKTRKAVGNVLGWASITLSVAVLVDSAVAEVDYANVTTPAAVIIAGLFGLYQTLVTSANVPEA